MLKPTASGLLSVQAELRKRKQREEAAAAHGEKTAVGSEAQVPGSEYDNIKSYKRKKLSADFVMPKEGINHTSSSSSSDGGKRRGAKDILDKYKVKGRGPNVSLLSETAKTPSAKLEAERQRVLRAKSKAYEELTKQGGSYSDDDGDNGDAPGGSGGLIDFRRKAAEEGSPVEEAQQQTPFFGDDGYGDEDEEKVTYLDDFGRTRTAPRSQVPQHLLPENNHGSYSEGLSFGRQTSFPVYRPPSPKLRVSRAVRKQIDSGAPPLQHFDPKAEVRNRGAGLFQFAKDEDERVKQMEALQRERARTERERQARFGNNNTNQITPQPQEGFASVEERPWGGDLNDHEEGTLPAEAYDEDHDQCSRPRDAPVPATVPAAPFDPFAAVELAARSASSDSRSQKRKKGH
ncbi:hypothetical protein V8E36_001460 [Tilletia maclaganii]